MTETKCLTCNGSLGENEYHRCYFGQHVIYEGCEPFRHEWEETSITLAYAQAVTHAVFCVAKYDEEVGDEVRPNVGRLSALLDEL